MPWPLLPAIRIPGFSNAFYNATDLSIYRRWLLSPHMYEFHEILGRKEKGRGRFSVISLGSLSRSPRHGIVLALRPGIVARSPIGVAPSMQGACTLIARNAISNSMQEPI